MPQFDPTSFSSQVFWLLICFSIFYFSMSRIFLPRIRDIIKARKDLIEQESAMAEEIKSGVDEINAVSQKIRTTAHKQYNLAIEQASHQVTIAREKALLDLYKTTTKIIEKSQVEISMLQEESAENRQAAIAGLITQINKKLLDS